MEVAHEPEAYDVALASGILDALQRVEDRCSVTASRGVGARIGAPRAPRREALAVRRIPWRSLKNPAVTATTIGARARRLSTRSRSFRHRCHHRHDVRRRRPADRAHRERVHLGVAHPPLILVCVDHKSQSYPALRTAGRFAVNFLARGPGGASRASFVHHAPAGQVRRRSPPHGAARRYRCDGRPGPARVRDGDAYTRRRSHDLRGPGRAGERTAERRRAPRSTSAASTRGCMPEPARIVHVRPAVAAARR